MAKASGGVRGGSRQSAISPPSIGDIVEYAGKRYEVGFVYPGAGKNWSYHTKSETGGRLRLQDLATHSGKTNVTANEVKLISRWAG